MSILGKIFGWDTADRREPTLRAELGYAVLTAPIRDANAAMVQLNYLAAKYGSDQDKIDSAHLSSAFSKRIDAQCLTTASNAG